MAIVSKASSKSLYDMAVILGFSPLSVDIPADCLAGFTGCEAVPSPWSGDLEPAARGHQLCKVFVLLWLLSGPSHAAREKVSLTLALSGSSRINHPPARLSR